MNIKIILVVLLCISGLLFPAHVSAAQKKVVVNLSAQRLYAYDGTALIYNFPISSGTITTPTPTGGFWPWIKLRYTRMQGGSIANGDYYNLPNVPYVIYFYNENYPRYLGYALHGTYWHNNFGYPMSHGCINLRTSDMAKLYYWIDLLSYNRKGEGSGTVIVITGHTPG